MENDGTYCGLLGSADKPFTLLGFSMPDGSIFLNAVMMKWSSGKCDDFNHSDACGEKLEAIECMLPEDTKDRLLFASVAVTAGFCEEVMFRGVMMTYLEQLNLSVVGAVILSSAVFGIIHLYLGWRKRHVDWIDGVRYSLNLYGNRFPVDPD
ncbi:CPBP family intramembrane glutamic endopeptidase [Domibacillus epiphyticus]|uniref:CAAX prenyl protease 2/Lysostaphin resistance protein A-like domain-containing protein n=1 Tax=Domibacillus epiphyticus TaxID=1714355 RepID=A0A1V2A4T9_9BACI|nr:CPBP family intramembrane glutamic endopeptidase [Domibacillus epiphyticus]OMP66015.1 hypothetical protein BTO28_14590 [Domibacillus epiphyticus]